MKSMLIWTGGKRKKSLRKLKKVGGEKEQVINF